MSDPELPTRPAPPRRPSDAVGAWLAWVGAGRLVLAAASVAVVVGGSAWLLRPGVPATEAALPVAGAVAGSAPPGVTLPPPSASPDPADPASPVGDESAVTEPVVHVAGAVATPGVYRLVRGARVIEAVEAAGGASGDAELDALNLAAPVADGQRIYVPAVGEVDPSTVPTVDLAAGASEAAVAQTGPIDLNRATAGELEQLPGVGPATAAAIVEDRDRNGPFATVDDLDRVPGIGPAKLAALRDRVTV